MPTAQAARTSRPHAFGGMLIKVISDKHNITSLDFFRLVILYKASLHIVNLSKMLAIML